MGGFLEKIIKFLVFLSLGVPLIVSRRTFFPFIFGKAIVFQILIEVGLIFYIVLLVKKPKFAPKLTLLNLALLAYFSVLILATVFGVDPVRSFWSTQERMTGTFNLLHFGPFFLLIGAVFETKRDVFWLLRASLLVSVMVGTQALLQKGRAPKGPLGNPGFLAAYSLFHIFFALYLLVKDRKIWCKFLYFPPFLFNLWVLYSTEERAALAGLILGLLIFLIAKVFTLRDKKRWGALILLICFVLSSGYILWQKRRDFLRGSETRRVSWKISWSAFKEKPVLGWGPENHIHAWAKHFDPQYAEYGRAWFDKAHNQVFEIGVTSGILGLLSYFSVLGIALYSFFKKKNFVFCSLLLAYFITNLFWFDTTSSLIPFFITLAFSQQRD